MKKAELEKTEEAQEKELETVESVILKSYLLHYRPFGRDCNPERIVYKTSAVIQDELADMAYVSIPDIAKLMFDAGFRVGLAPDHRPAWMMIEI